MANTAGPIRGRASFRKAGTGELPRVVMTMNTLDLDGSDVFKGVFDLHTDDLGKSWTEAQQRSTMAPRMEMIGGVERPVAASDFWPCVARCLADAARHGAFGGLHARMESGGQAPSAYRVCDVRSCGPTTGRIGASWRCRTSRDFANAGAGCTQRVDQADGTILLPFYFKPPDSQFARGRDAVQLRRSRARVSRSWRRTGRGRRNTRSGRALAGPISAGSTS